MRLLYIDDEPDIREVAAMAFELDGDIEVRQAGSGAAALEMLDAGGWSPDVVLLDVMMPGADGPATLAELRLRPALATTPIIFITARAQPQERARLMGLGAIGVITKPFDPMSLAQDVRAILAAA